MQYTKREIIYAIRMFCSELAKDGSKYQAIWKKACESPSDQSLEYLLIYSFGFVEGQAHLTGNESDKIIAEALSILTSALHGAPNSVEQINILRLAYIDSRSASDARAAQRASEEAARHSAEAKKRASDPKFN